jgi:hypothetical protein
VPDGGRWPGAHRGDAPRWRASSSGADPGAEHVTRLRALTTGPGAVAAPTHIHAVPVNRALT